MRRRRLVLLLSVVWLTLAAPWAQSDTAIDALSFDPPELQPRYKGLIEEIRCPRCQNVNLAGSDAPIARDLRLTVHRLLHEGQSDQQVRDFLQARYGDFVLYNPPLKPSTLLLWFLPPGLALIAAGVLIRLVRQRADRQDDDLDAAEQARLDALLAAAPRPAAGADDQR